MFPQISSIDYAFTILFLLKKLLLGDKWPLRELPACSPVHYHLGGEHESHGSG